MEKFAVDLEKVLNEFEYNEERRESGPTSSIRTSHSSLDSLGALRQQPPPLPPAAIYRKPSFERINLADANFAASPPKSSGLNFNHGLYERQQENVGTFAYSHKPQVLNNRNFSQEPSLTNEVNINKQLITQHDDHTLPDDWQNQTVPGHTDEKPDLLEYNSTTADSDLNDAEVHNQLPDLTTSVRTPSHNVNNNDIDNLPSSLDLISSANGTLLTANNQESTLISDYSTFKERILVEGIDGLVPPVHNGLSSTVLSSDHVILEEQGKFKNKKHVNTAGLYNKGVTQVETQCIKEEKELGNRKDRHEILNDNSLDLNQNNGADDNRFERNENLSATLQDYHLEELPQEETKDISNRCDLTKSIEKTNIISFGNDEDFSQTQLLEYLESVDKEYEETLTSQVPFSGEFLELPDEKNTEVDNSDSKVENKKESCSERIDTSESKIDTCKKSLLPINSVQSISTHDTDLSAKIISQIDFGENCAYKTLSLPQGVDCKIKSEISNSTDLERSQIKNNNAIALDCKNEIEITTSLKNRKSKEITNSLKQNEPDKSTKIINHKPFSKEEDRKDLITSASNTQTIESKSKNPFDQDDYDHKTPKLEVKIKSTNPFEDDNESPLEDNNKNSCKDNPGNPFEDSAENPFEDNNRTLCEENNISEVPAQTSQYNHSQQIKPIDISVKSNNSALNRASVRELTREDSESHLKNRSFSGSSVETALSMAENPISSLQLVDEARSGSTSENIDQGENISVENPSSDCSPSTSSSPEAEHFNGTLSSSARMIPIKQAVESSLDVLEFVDEAGVPAEEERPLRPNSLELPQRITVESSTPQSAEMSEPGGSERETAPEDRRLGKIAPFWIPDADTTMCMQCQLKFTVIRRRHHCRACGQVLCNKCCCLKARLEYMDFEEARVCQPCFTILEAVSASESASPQRRQPNPNNPMEYCSTIPPLQQAKGAMHQPPPSVMVPVSVLKREGRNKSDVTKQVMFSDGIRPGGDLTELDGSTEPRMPFRRSSRLTKRVGTPPGGGVMSPSMRRVMDSSTHSFIPAEGESLLPPVVTRQQGETTYLDQESPIDLNQPVVKFALNRNLFVSVKRVLLDCCVNRECWCFSSEGLACVGQDEVVFLLECLPQETLPPKDVFLLINFLYQDAAKGATVSEMSFTPATSNSLLGSRDHGGFLYIRTSYQCTAQLVLPSPPYLVAVLVHRWETPWARLFPIRLMLRLGAEFRYYPCPLVSVRNRPPLYTDIGHTIINILADFRKYSYTLPSVRGLVIHMEDRQTTINIPRNRYDQVVRALNNSNDSVLAFGANLSLAADSHLVCMQTSEDENTSYHTQAINIHNKPRKVTGASFVVFNGALKVPGLAGKSNIVEDGLMVQVPNETMAALRTALRDMRDYTIGCGPNAEETVLLQWTADDTNFNIGVKSCIDGKALDGVPSIRVHNGTDYSGGVRLIRWTEVFILQCEDSDHTSEPLDISRLSESIARATCLALVPLLDLLSAASLTTLAVRATIHPDNVGYEAGSNGEKLPPLYMKSLDNELVAVVHQAALASQENPAVLELVFRIMEQG